MRLSILIPTLPSRKESYGILIEWLNKQLHYDVEIVSWDAVEPSIGAKRNYLLHEARGEYVCFVDDDDSISPNYIGLLMEGINKGVDCCSLKGMYGVNGKFEGFFEHSLKYKEWKTNQLDPIGDGIRYERYPNHLNCIKSSIAKQFKFPDKNFGEDHDWSKQIHESGLIKTEHYIDEVIYYYKKVTK